MDKQIPQKLIASSSPLALPLCLARLVLPWRKTGIAADRVTSRMLTPELIHWNRPKDRSVADAVRLEVLEMLVKLK